MFCMCYVSTATIPDPFQINNIGTVCPITVMILNISPSADTWEAEMQKAEFSACIVFFM